VTPGIRVYRYGIHRGEENLVIGNRKAGMVNFSGCHLSCGFCYTPETSVLNQGLNMTEDELYGVLEDLRSAGAGNWNFISPSHLWRWLEPVLHRLRIAAQSQLGTSQGELPLILKISGFETEKLVRRMAAFASVFVPDFKVWDEEAARNSHLPARYGEVALRAIEIMMETHPPIWSDQGELLRGVLVRHLVMPGYLADSLKVIENLGEIRFQGVLNIMTYFHDVKRARLVRAHANDIWMLIEKASEMGDVTLLIDGKLPGSERGFSKEAAYVTT